MESVSSLLTFRSRRDIDHAEVGARRWRQTHVFSESRDLGQSEGDFVAVLRLQEAQLHADGKNKTKPPRVILGGRP